MVATNGQLLTGPAGVNTGTTNFFAANSALLDAALRVFNILDYGATTTAADNSVAVSNAITAASRSGGGIILVPHGRYAITNQITITNYPNGAGAQNQKPLIIVGEMTDNDLGGYVGNDSGSVLCWQNNNASQYNAWGGYCIRTFGFGSLEMRNVTMENISNTLPILFDSSTLLHIHDCRFAGGTNGVYPGGIVLGGQSSTEFDASTNSAFQGYGTVIENNSFFHLNACVTGNTFANGIIVSHNNVKSGSGYAPFQFLGLYGCENVVEFNKQIEMPNYIYGVVFSNQIGGEILGNSGWDFNGGAAAGLAVVRIEHTCSNVICIAPGDDTTAPLLVSDAGTNTSVISSNGIAIGGTARFGNGSTATGGGTTNNVLGFFGSTLLLTNTVTLHPNFPFGTPVRDVEVISPTGSGSDFLDALSLGTKVWMNPFTGDTTPVARFGSAMDVPDSSYADHFEFWLINSSSVFAEKFRMTASGALGVNTTNPAAALEVNGTGLFDGGIMTHDTNILVAGSATAYSGQFATIASGWTNNTATNAVYLYTGTSGNAVLWWCGGTGGASPCANAIITDTVAASGGNFPVPQGCGVQITSGVGLTAVVVFKP